MPDGVAVRSGAAVRPCSQFIRRPLIYLRASDSPRRRRPIPPSSGRPGRPDLTALFAFLRNPVPYLRPSNRPPPRGGVAWYWVPVGRSESRIGDEPVLPGREAGYPVFSLEVVDERCRGGSSDSSDCGTGQESRRYVSAVESSSSACRAGGGRPVTPGVAPGRAGRYLRVRA